MEHEKDVAAAAAAVVIMSCCKLLVKKNKEKRKRRWWMLSLHKNRQRYNGSNLMADLLKEPSGKFENFCRMSAQDFEHLLNKIGEKIAKQDTIMRKAIPIKERLALTLRFLASGDSFVSLGYLFKISHQSISQIVPEVCVALLEALRNQIQLPESQEDWRKLERGFCQRWNFPHCVGAIDGKHVLIQAPFKSESTFYNYKKTFSIILLALVDSDYCFTFVDVGAQGRMNDAGVFNSTVLYQKIVRGELLLPPSEPLQGRQKSVPYVIVGDDAFPLTNNILKPYHGVHPKESVERIFNYRLCRARRIVENVFGIIASVFRLFRKPMVVDHEKAALFTTTCLYLHNFLRRSKTSRNIYTPVGMLDHEVEGTIKQGAWRQNPGNVSLAPFCRAARKPSQQAKEIRNEFAEYFKTNGAVEWQEIAN